MLGFDHFLSLPIEKQPCIYCHWAVMLFAWKFLAFAAGVYRSGFYTFVVWAFWFFFSVKVQASFTLFQDVESASTAINSASAGKSSTKLQFPSFKYKSDLQFKNLINYLLAKPNGEKQNIYFPETSTSLLSSSVAA